MREKSEQQEQEIATKKLLLAEVDDSLQAYKLKVERLEEQYNNVSIDSLHQRIQEMQSKLKLARIQLSHVKREGKDSTTMQLKNMRKIISKKGGLRRQATAALDLLLNPKNAAEEEGQEQEGGEQKKKENTLTKMLQEQLEQNFASVIEEEEEHSVAGSVHSGKGVRVPQKSNNKGKKEKKDEREEQQTEESYRISEED